MPKIRFLNSPTYPGTFQHALDAPSEIGRWEWNATTDRVRSDAFAALLFNVVPEEAEDGVPAASYIDAIHGEDRDRVLALIWRSAQASSTYSTECRVITNDGRTIWVLAWGQFTSDATGKPAAGSGIFVDITPMRMSEGTLTEAEPDMRETPLERAADHAIAAQQAIVELCDTELKAHADALLMAVGRRLARQEVQDRLNSSN